MVQPDRPVAADNSEAGDSLAQTTAILFRSRIEIGRILDALVASRSTVSADLDGERLFLTRLLCVDPDREFFAIAYSEQKSANAGALEQSSLTLHATHEGARIEFSAANPTDTLIQDEAAIRLEFPVVLVRFQRRQYPRYALSTDVSLRCVADSRGFAPFEARIADISRGGLGVMIYDPDIHLPPGTVLRDCRIMIPQRESVITDLQVRYTRPVVLGDGSRVNRSGLQFLQKTDELEALIRVFVVDLGPEAEP